MMKRLFDLVFAVIALGLLSIPMALIGALIKVTSRGPIIYWSDRVGKGNRIFRMPKFRTMRIGTPALATHLLNDPGHYLTQFGGFLRRTSLDELPQIYTILKGEMSVVGPRPALFNQEDLIALRSEKGVHDLMPGLTGWAQVNGRDELPIPVKVAYDEYYLKNRSLLLDLKIILLTVKKVLAREGVLH